MTRFDSRRLSWFLVAAAMIVVAGCSKSAENDAAATTTASPTTSSTTAVPNSNTAVGASSVTTASANMPVASKEPVEQGDPIIVLHTTLGNLYVRLYERQAPRTVANFFDYARTHHYDGTVFHQVESGYVAIGGALDQELKAKPVRYPVVNESQNGLKNIRGSLAMARDPADPNSATAMFFINLADNPKLDYQGASPEQHGFCVFGQVIDGLDVVDQLSAVKTGQEQGFTSMPTPRVVLNSIKMLRAVRDPQVQPVGLNTTSNAKPVTPPNNQDANRYSDFKR